MISTSMQSCDVQYRLNAMTLMRMTCIILRRKLSWEKEDEIHIHSSFYKERK